MFSKIRQYFPMLFLPLLAFCAKTEIEQDISEVVDAVQPISTYDYPTGENVIHHSQYSLSYNCDHEQANWVLYSLTKQEVYSSMDRTDDFREDPNVSCTSAQLTDYKYSGYDRGHLSPAADNKISEEVMSESFYMSNMSPQTPGFNRGIWAKLENQVRDWALDRDSIIVITGPVLKEGLETIGEGVSIPEQYYKILYDPSSEEMTAFLMRNESSSEELSSFVVTVDAIETATGINFFPTGEEEIESTLTNW